MKPRHKGWAAYLVRRGLEGGQARSDGSIELLFGERLRVLVRPGLRGVLVFECRLVAVDASGTAGEQRLMAALEAAGSRWLRSGEALVLAPQRGLLLLQQQVAADGDAGEVEAALLEFVAAIGFWRRHLGTL